jgi:DNA-binding SARP family transcriptional activator
MAPPALAHREGLRIFVLGGFRIEGVSGALANDGWTRRKARQLLKCLLSRPSRRLTRDEAYELFWPDSDVAPSNLRVVLHALRQALAGLGVDRPDELVVSDHDGVAFNGSGIWVDADAFERLAAPLHDAAASDDDLEAAARLYAGEFLADDPYELWATARRDHLRRLWGDVLMELSHRRERRGEIELAAAALERRLAADPCDELATVELMRLWARHGRRTDALRAYRRLADALLRELVVEPGAEAMRLRDHILSGENGQAAVSGATLAAPAPVSLVAAVDVAVAAPDTLPGPAASAPALAAPGTPAPSFEPSYPFPAPARLVGRQLERAALDQIIERGRSGGQVMLIGGPAGVGKSALVGALVQEARARGYLCLVGGSFEQEYPLPLGSIRDALGDLLLAQEPQQVLSELGGMVTDLEPIIPELRYHLGLPGDGASRQLESNHLLSVVQSCLRVLATRRPVLLCLEDLHAADSATIAALPYFGRQIRRLPVTVLGTYRTDEMSSDHRLARLLPKLVRERMVDEMRLRPLAREETAQLATALLGGPVDETVTCWLHSMTEGNPLLGELVLLALRDEGRLVARPDGRWGVATATVASADPLSGCPLLPPAALAVLERRLAPLDASTREVLDVAAVLGQTFNLVGLSEALGADRADTVARLETLRDAGLLRESGPGYRFEQPLLREARLQRMSVHRRAALEARTQPATGAMVVHGPRSSTPGNGWHPRLPLPTGG